MGGQKKAFFFFLYESTKTLRTVSEITYSNPISNSIRTNAITYYLNVNSKKAFKTTPIIILSIIFAVRNDFSGVFETLSSTRSVRVLSNICFFFFDNISTMKYIPYTCNE